MVASAEKRFDVAIVGGGLASLALAIGLIKRGISIQIYEGANGWTNQGAGLVFAQNSIEAMKKISPQIYQMFSQRCSGQGWESKKNLYMDYRDGTTNGDLVTSVTCGDTGQKSIHRTLFAQDLAALLPENTLLMGKRLIDAETKKDGMTSLKFADGSCIDAMVVVGGDGIKSQCRQILLGRKSPEATPKFAGEFAYRGMVPMAKAIEVLGDEFARNSMVNMAPGRLTTTYPVEKGTMLNLVAALSLDKWEHEEWIVPSSQEALQKDFAGCGPVMQKVVSLMEKPSKWALFDHPECSTFYKGRFALIGDAAHASCPHQGAGCGQAFEDALVMCNLLADDWVYMPEHVEYAFEAYDAIRRPRTLKVVNTSRENGEICMLRGKDTGEDLKEVKENLDERFRWIWYEDLDAQVEQAQAKLHEVMIQRHGIANGN